MNTAINKDIIKKEETIKSNSNIKNITKNSIEANFDLDLLEGTEAYYSERYGWTLRRKSNLSSSI